MVFSQQKVRALGLCSGGLDSRLAAAVLMRQGIAVEWISCETPFFSADKARDAARLQGIPLIVDDITPIYLQMLKNPPCGYGQHMNPCLDCHALMFREAGRCMQAKNFDFLFSGEVLGQRPMSQTKPSLRYVEKHSGFDGYILRPLSALRLPETAAEKKGLVDRQALLDITGRGRKIQIRLAKEYGISDYPAPAGGCLLTDPGFSKRLRDLFAHRDIYTHQALHLLKYGRHFRVNAESKIIVGRTRSDNEKIESLYNPVTDSLIKLKHFPGPTTLLPDGPAQEIVFLAAGICAGYSKVSRDMPVAATVVSGRRSDTIRVIPIAPETVKHLMV